LTNDSAATIITFVLRRVRVAIVGVLLAPGLGFSAALPLEHRHDADAHHPHAQVHQHFAPHDHDGAECSPDGDAHVTWFHHAVAQPAPTTLYVPALLVLSALDDLPVFGYWVAVEALDSAPSHGPPRQTLSLRAPPAPPSLAI
jgi:hypothetical protein